MCDASCSTCFSNTFYGCLSCPSSTILNGNLCSQSPSYAIQMITTLTCITLLILPQTMQVRRFMVASKLFDVIQIVAYFKYLVIYEPYRQNYLYLGIRAWGGWSEGWLLINSGTGLGVFHAEEGDLDRALRIVMVALAVITVDMLIGLGKVLGDEYGLKFSKYLQKNWKNCLLLATYVTMQDMALVIANQFYNLKLEATATILAVGFIIVIIASFFGMFYVVNVGADYQSDKYNYYYSNMFVFNMDYDLIRSEGWPGPDQDINQSNVSVSVNDNDRKVKKFPYSNLRVLSLIMKIIYPFLIIDQINGGKTQIYGIFGLLVLFESVFWMIFPFNPKEYIQAGILAIGQLIMFILLFMYGSGIMSDTATLILCLSLIGLAAISIGIELLDDNYKLLEVDLYDLNEKIQPRVQQKIKPKGVQQVILKERSKFQKEKAMMEEELRRLEEQSKRRIQTLDEQEMYMEEQRIKRQRQIQQEMEQLKLQKQLNPNQKSIEYKERQLKSERLRNMTSEQAEIEFKRQSIQVKILEKYKMDKEKIKPYKYNKRRKFIYTHTIEKSGY